MAENKKNMNKLKKKKNHSRKLKGILLVELILLLCAGGLYFLFLGTQKAPGGRDDTDYTEDSDDKDSKDGEDQKDKDNSKNNNLSEEELEIIKEQERLQQEIQERKDLIAKADRLALGYDYDGAIELIKSYQGAEGNFSVYTELNQAIEKYENQKSSLVLYGGSYTSVTQFNHIFFHSLIADNSKAFDGEYDQTGYNMYMTTVYEFKKMMEKMYEDGYVLVSIHDIAKKEKQEDGSTKFVAQEIYLPKGKKPFVLSQDDVNYYDYMEGDGFASRIVIGEDGKPTCEMILDDGSVVTGPFDIVPILDEFIEEHPDFSYRGAKGILALTGYEGVLGYRTNDPTSPTYQQDVETAKKVVEALKEDGWEFASHSWGHKNSYEITVDHFRRDTERWMKEVAPIIGPTDVYIFPYGVDIETTMGTYSSEKYMILKENGFDFFCGVYKEPWMHIKNDYVRMTRRPLDGQAMLQFPERLADLFAVEEVIDPERPPRDW